jgi:hypothetical protein
VSKRLLNGLVYLYLGGGFLYAWLSPLRPAAKGWMEGAGAVVMTELWVTLLVGPLLRAVSAGKPPGLARILTPGALLLQAAAYVLVILIWRAAAAPLLITLTYVFTVLARSVDLAQGDEDSLLEHAARMIIWFVSIAVACALGLLFMSADRWASGRMEAWSLKVCAMYFLLLALGEALLPYFRRGVDPRILPEDQLKT